MTAILNWIAEWLNAVDQLMQDAILWLVGQLTILFLDIAAYLIDFGTQIVITILTAAGLLTNFSDAWNSLNVNVRAVLEVLQLPQAVSILIAAYTLRWVIKLIPGI